MLFPLPRIATVLLSTSWFSVCLSSASAQQPPSSNPPPLPHCYLEIAGVSDRGELQRIWQASWGSYIGDIFQGKVLRIRVGTTARTGGSATIECFWIGRNMPSSGLVIYGKESTTVNVPSAYFSEFYVRSPESKNHVTHLVLAQRHTERGLQQHGWIVSVTDSAKRRLALKASSESLQKLFENPSAFAALPLIKP